MTTHSELRLLPWSSPEGKPCYLSTDDDSSHLSRLADDTKAIQPGLAADLMTHAMKILNDKETRQEVLLRLATDLTGALRDALRMATSRGQRLFVPHPFAHEDSGNSQQPGAVG